MKNASHDTAHIDLYPLTFDPVFKDYPWGGRNLATELGRVIPDGIIAESWDIAAHVNGSSTVRCGALSGLTLPQVLDEWGLTLVGSRNVNALEHNRFPLLIKLLDANTWLSVQVHPADDYALENEGEYGKTEMWVILRADEDAELIYGFNPGVSADVFAKAIEEGATADWLYRLPVSVGDVVFVPAGTVHALGPGVIVAEIQQNSDTTYRIFDWGRPRPIHIKQALDVLDFDSIQPKAFTPQPIRGTDFEWQLIGQCQYFRTERLRMQTGQRFDACCDGSTFEIWGVLDGTARVESSAGEQTLDAIDWMLLPAALGAYSVTAESDVTMLRVYTPELQP